MSLYDRLVRAIEDELNQRYPLINGLERGEYEAVARAAAAEREIQGDGPVPFDPEHPDYCLRDRGCSLEAGHKGKCYLTAALT
jgi:hypothetical protein